MVKSDMKTASHVQVDAKGLVIDGRRFPYYLSEQPITVQSEHTGLREVTLTLLCEAVTIDPSLTVETDGDLRMVSQPVRVTITDEAVDRIAAAIRQQTSRGLMAARRS